MRSSSVRYQLFAQNRDGSLIIRSLQKNKLISTTAHEILSKFPISEFSPEDAVIIGYIACESPKLSTRAKARDPEL